MTDRDESTGQFSSSDEPILTGIAGVEHDAGYIPLPDPTEGIPSDELTVEQAAEAMGIVGTPESEIASYVDGQSYEDPVENPKETVTVERAGKELEAAEARDADVAEAARLDQIREGVDQLRGKPDEQGIDVDKALNDPKFKEALDQRLSETDTVRQEAEAEKQKYSAALQEADQYQSAAFRARFPELATRPVEQWESVLSTMQPDRAREAVGTLQQLVQVKSALHQEQQQKQVLESQQREVYAKEQNAIFAEKTKDIPAAQMRAIEAEAPKVLEFYGASPAQFLEAIAGSTAFPRAAAELMILDLVKYHQIKNAPKAIAARAALPPVQKPGFAQPRGSSVDQTIRSLDRQLDFAKTEGQQKAIARQILNLMDRG
jgi:hypothetical protein